MLYNSDESTRVIYNTSCGAPQLEAIENIRNAFTMGGIMRDSGLSVEAFKKLL
jgi:hypothetical protein